MRLLAPVLPSKVVAIGRNYAEHARELGNEVPPTPVLFLKPSTSVIGPGDPIVRPEGVGRVDFEGELAVIVGKLARRLEPADAIQAVLGFTCANDVTARDLQRADGQWTRGKGFDTFCPLGPWIETDLDSSDLALHTLVNGEVRQQARTSQLEHGVAELLSFVSRVMTLLPGDVLLTGTPAGVGPRPRRPGRGRDRGHRHPRQPGRGRIVTLTSLDDREGDLILDGRGQIAEGTPVARELRAVTPDGYVWHVRRRRVRRRRPWARRTPAGGARFHGEEELRRRGARPSLGRPLAVPERRGRRARVRPVQRRRERFGQRAAGRGRRDPGRPGAGLAHGQRRAAVAAPVRGRQRLAAARSRGRRGLLFGLNQVHRPWYVELQRQGLADAPRRVWRVRGWRRSGRLMRELTAAIQDGRIDNERAVILRHQSPGPG